jgi:endoglucanase
MAAFNRRARDRDVCLALTLLVFAPAVAGPDVAAQQPAPAPSPAPENPLAGKRLYVDPNSPARRQAETWRRSKPTDAQLIAQIASQPVAKWLGGWVSDIRREVDQAVKTITRAGALPVFVAYNIPGRDCGSYSAGGAGGAAAYRRWIQEFANGVGGRSAIVILEPDALAGMDCLNAAARIERVTLLREAVLVLKARGAAVYVDAGNAHWHPPAEMATRLNQAGIASADGFSLNVSNYEVTSVNVAYGEALSRLVGGKHFLIDTSRNGGSPAADPNQWCNPEGRALGLTPTTNTGNPLIDAFLWVKPPGESDGTCGGGPAAGTWWAAAALELSRMAAAITGLSKN